MFQANSLIEKHSRLTVQNLPGFFLLPSLSLLLLLLPSLLLLPLSPLLLLLLPSHQLSTLLLFDTAQLFQSRLLCPFTLPQILAHTESTT